MPALDAHAWMLATALEQLEYAQGLHRQFFRINRSSQGPHWEPPVDMVDGGSTVEILVALPGVAEDCLDVQLEQCTLIVRGQRRFGAGVGSGAVVRLEIPYGRFERRIALPAGPYRTLTTQLEHGCLRISMERMP